MHGSLTRALGIELRSSCLLEALHQLSHLPSVFPYFIMLYTVVTQSYKNNLNVFSFSTMPEAARGGKIYCGSWCRTIQSMTDLVALGLWLHKGSGWSSIHARNEQSRPGLRVPSVSISLHR